MAVKVCDMIMGAGKTESAITQMKRDKDSKYIFITPYLDEVKRIKESCPDRNFKEPHNFGNGKLSSLHTLMEHGENIASTHALFRRYNDKTMELIKNGGYKLILDEVFDTVEMIDVSEDDVSIMLSEGIIGVGKAGRVFWTGGNYTGAFESVRDVCQSGNVILFNQKMMLWTFPEEIFHAFSDVIILTYLFDSQFQKYYFDMCGIETTRIGTIYKNGKYQFSDKYSVPDYVAELRSKIHIVENKRLNAIGEQNTAFSKSWYQKAVESKRHTRIKDLRNNMYNFFRNICNCKSDRVLWTTFSAFKEEVKSKGYTNGFLSCNARATNAYRDRDCLAYCVNVFYNPFMKRYFESHGVEVRQDEYALSEMIQWIWRSAIRDGRDIYIYIPSKRMRNLLKEWLDKQAEG